MVISGWGFLQDYDGEVAEKIHESSAISIPVQNGFLIALDSNGKPVNWYELPDIEWEDIWNGC